MKMKLPSPAFTVSCVALVVALGPAVHAAGSVFSADIVDGQVKTRDLGFHAVTDAKLAPDAVDSTKVFDNSISVDDLVGADVIGTITLPGGSVGIGRCIDIPVTANGAHEGEGAIFTLRGDAPEGLLFYGARVSADNTVIMKVCNMSGGTSPAVTNLPVNVITFG